MQYFPIVNMLECKANLSEPIQNVILAPILQLSPSLLLGLILVFNAALQVTTICVVHDYAQFTFLRLVNFTEPHDVRMLQHLKDLGLTQSFSSLILVHVLNIDLLDDCVSLVGLALHEVGCSERANAQCLHFFVGFVLLLWWVRLHFLRKFVYWVLNAFINVF